MMFAMLPDSMAAMARLGFPSFRTKATITLLRTKANENPMVVLRYFSVSGRMLGWAPSMEAMGRANKNAVSEKNAPNAAAITKT